MSRRRRPSGSRIHLNNLNRRSSEGNPTHSSGSQGSPRPSSKVVRIATSNRTPDSRGGGGTITAGTVKVDWDAWEKTLQDQKEEEAKKTRVTDPDDVFMFGKFLASKTRPKEKATYTHISYGDISNSTDSPTSAVAGGPGGRPQELCMTPRVESDGRVTRQGSFAQRGLVSEVSATPRTRRLDINVGYTVTDEVPRKGSRRRPASTRTAASWNDDDIEPPTTSLSSGVRRAPVIDGPRARHAWRGHKPTQSSRPEKVSASKRVESTTVSLMKKESAKSLSRRADGSRKTPSRVAQQVRWERLRPSSATHHKSRGTGAQDSTTPSPVSRSASTSNVVTPRTRPKRVAAPQWSPRFTQASAHGRRPPVPKTTSPR